MDLLYLRVAQISRCSDLAIFVLIDRQTDRRTELITLPLAHARGVIKMMLAQSANYPAADSPYLKRDAKSAATPAVL
jgi:hypothetical protein